MHKEIFSHFDFISENKYNNLYTTYKITLKYLHINGMNQ